MEETATNYSLGFFVIKKQINSLEYKQWFEYNSSLEPLSSPNTHPLLNSHSKMTEKVRPKVALGRNGLSSRSRIANAARNRNVTKRFLET